MATTIPSTALVPVAPAFSNTERLALAGFLAGYTGLTRQAYELDLRQFASWCQQHQLALFPSPPRRHRAVRPRSESPRPGPGHYHPPSSARWLGSTVTPSRKNCWTIRLLRMCGGGRGWIMSRTPLGWTATNSARC
jgi:hypothetical protein